MLTKFHWFFSMFLVSHTNLHSSSVLPSLTDLWAYCCPQFRKWPTHASIIRNIIAIGVSIVPCNAYQRWVTVPIFVNHHPQLTIPLLLLRASSCCLPNPIAVWQPCIHVRRTWTWKVFSYFTYTQQSKVCPSVCVCTLYNLLSYIFIAVRIVIHTQFLHSSLFVYISGYQERQQQTIITITTRAACIAQCSCLACTYAASAENVNKWESKKEQESA